MHPCEKLSLDNSLIDVIGNFFLKNFDWLGQFFFLLTDVSFIENYETEH